MQALPNCSIAEAEQQGGGEVEEEEQQQAPSPAKGGRGAFGRTQAVKAQSPQVAPPPPRPPLPNLHPLSHTALACPVRWPMHRSARPYPSCKAMLSQKSCCGHCMLSLSSESACSSFCSVLLLVADSLHMASKCCQYLHVSCMWDACCVLSVYAPPYILPKQHIARIWRWLHTPTCHFPCCAAHVGTAGSFGICFCCWVEQAMFACTLLVHSEAVDSSMCIGHAPRKAYSWTLSL